MTNLYRYWIELFQVILDIQLQELNNRLYESNTELLIWLICLWSNDWFVTLDKEKILLFPEFYLKDFSVIDLMTFEIQFEVYIIYLSLKEIR